MRRTCLRKTLAPPALALALALALLALPVAASSAVGSASPGSSTVAKVLDAFTGLWRVVSPEVVASPTPVARAKDGEDDDDERDDPPLDELGAAFIPTG